MAHLFFNIFGILIWYPVPKLRSVPIRAAKALGETTSKYRWFAIVYLAVAFFLLPSIIFGLSLAGWPVLVGCLTPVILLIIVIISINLLQENAPGFLPYFLRNWDFLPSWMRSLEPIDRLFVLVLCCRKKRIDFPEEGTLAAAQLEEERKMEMVANKGTLDDFEVDLGTVGDFEENPETETSTIDGPQFSNSGGGARPTSRRISRGELWINDPEQFIEMQTDF